MDPDPGGPKTCGSLKRCLAISGKNLPRMTMKEKTVEKSL
jgi:hypothetical protein